MGTSHENTERQGTTRSKMQRKGSTYSEDSEGDRVEEVME